LNVCIVYTKDVMLTLIIITLIVIYYYVIVIIDYRIDYSIINVVINGKRIILLKYAHNRGWEEIEDIAYIMVIIIYIFYCFLYWIRLVLMQILCQAKKLTQTNWNVIIIYNTLILIFIILYVHVTYKYEYDDLPVTWVYVTHAKCILHHNIIY